MTTDNERYRHDFKGQLSVILGFAELLLSQMANDDPRRGDLEEIRTAAIAAVALLGELFPPAAGSPE